MTQSINGYNDEKWRESIFASFAADNKCYVRDKFRCPHFPEQPGLDNERLCAELLALAGDKTRITARDKASAFRFICENMLLDVNPHDFFPAFGCWNRDHKPMSDMIRRCSSNRWNAQMLP